MKGYWEILEIQPTNELKDIKKAYAKMLKKYHPEDDAEGYQKLRQAYDWAVKYCKIQAVQSDKAVIYFDSASELNENREYSGQEDENYTDIDDEAKNSGSKEISSSISKELQWSNFYERAEEIYSDFYERIKLDNWIKLISDTLLWNIELHEYFSDRIFEFVLHHRYLPKEVLGLLEQHFKWSEIGWYDSEDTDFLELVSRLRDPLALSYSYFKPGLEIDFDEYLKRREEAYNKLKHERYTSVCYALDDCLILIDNDSEVIDNDPELIYIDAKKDIYFGKLEEALEKLNKIINEYPMEYKYYIVRAEIYLIQEKMEAAIADLIQARKDKCLLEVTREPLAKAYLKLEKYESLHVLLNESSPGTVKTIDQTKFDLKTNNEVIEHLKKCMLMKPFDKEIRSWFKLFKISKKNIIRYTYKETQIKSKFRSFIYRRIYNKRSTFVTLFFSITVICIIFITNTNGCSDLFSNKNTDNATIVQMLKCGPKKLPMSFENLHVIISKDAFDKMRYSLLKGDSSQSLYNNIATFGEQTFLGNYIPIDNNWVMVYYPFEDFNSFGSFSKIKISGEIDYLTKEKQKENNIKDVPQEIKKATGIYKVIHDRYIIIDDFNIGWF